MDFNDIEQRLRRLYSAISEMSSTDFENEIKITRSQLNGGTQVSIRFGNLSEEELYNRVSLAIGLVAGLKDHIKNRLRVLGKNPKTVETMINNSPDFCLIMDLNNQEKHGYPLQEDRKRSGKDPKLQSVRQAMAISGTGGGIRLDGTLTAPQNTSIAILGVVVDGNGNPLPDIASILSSAISEAEKFIDSEGIRV